MGAVTGGRSRLGRWFACIAVVLGFSECGGRTAMNPFGLLPSDEGGASGASGSFASGGSSFGGTSVGGTSFGGTSVGGASAGGTGISGGSAGVGGFAGRSGSGGRAGAAGLGGAGGRGPTGGVAGESGFGGEGDSAGQGGDAGSPAAIGLALGAFHSCARFDDGTLRCWGTGGYIGSGDTATIGDDETPAGRFPVDIGGSVTQMAAGWYQTCVILESGRVRCFGIAGSGFLGYGNAEDIGDDESPASAGNVNVGGAARCVSAGPNHACVCLASGAVRCWGRNDDFQLGRPGETIGDNESPVSVPPVEVGGFVVGVATGIAHTCALLDDGSVRCWGGGSGGRLGYGNQNTIGDDETPAWAGNVPIGGRAIQIVAGVIHTCALLDDGNVRCWGSGSRGILGYGNEVAIGDDETPASVGNVNVGGTVTRLAAGDFATCALLAGGAVRCWGWARQGELGYGNMEDIGDDETPASAGDVDVGGPVRSIDVGFLHVCATLFDGAVRCWGRASTGALGYGNVLDIGDDETPASAGNVTLF